MFCWCCVVGMCVFFFKQKTAYEMRISDWSSDVCSSDLCWLVQHAPWPRGGDSSIIWRLIGQTLILYVIVLIPVLWVGRRISRPLRSLAVAARDFAPGDGDTPLEERGPGDVRAVIAAFNARSEEHTSELQSLMRISYAVFCL